MFNFRLQTVLDVRKTFEEKALAEFSEQQKEFLKEKDALKTIEQQKIKLIDAIRKIQGKSVNIYEIILKSSSIKQCHKKEAIQKQRVYEASQKVDKKREELIETSKKRKIMEILKTKQFEKYKTDLGMIERAAIDEMAIVLHNRREKA